MKLFPKILTFLLSVISVPGVGQDHIPRTSGLSGFVLAGPGFFNVATNRVYAGPPLLGTIGNIRVANLIDAPGYNSSAAFAVAGEINYTFAKSRTQIYTGNRLEDLLRLDVVIGTGIRQELRDSSILSLMAITTPLKLKFWADPYVVGQDREWTSLDFAGIRLRWGRIFNTGLELTATARRYVFGLESSGEWLMERNQLTFDQRQLLDRNGYVLRLMALYRIDLKKHRFEPAVRYIDDRHNGLAMANQGYTAKLTYIFRQRKYLLNANFAIGQRWARATNPVYNNRYQTTRAGAAISAFLHLKQFENSVLSLMLVGEIMYEDANIDFFDGGARSVIVGLSWRHLRS